MFLPVEILYNIGQHLGVMEREVLKLPPRKLSLQRVQDLEKMLKLARTSGIVDSWVRDHRLVIVLYQYEGYLSHLYTLQRDSNGNECVLGWDRLRRYNVIWDSKTL